MEELITPSEVAAILRIHVQTVYRLADEGVIPGSRIGRSWRFSKKDVLELVSIREGKGSRGENSGNLARGKG